MGKFIILFVTILSAFTLLNASQTKQHLKGNKTFNAILPTDSKLIEKKFDSHQALNIVSIVNAPIVRVKRCEFRLEALDTVRYDQSEATGINDKGEVVGCFKENNKNKWSAFLCSPSGKIQILDVPGAYVSGLRINNASQVVGNTIINEHSTGFFWDPVMGITVIEGLGGANTIVRGLNDLGQVVGYSETGATSEFTGQPVKHAFIWQNGQINDLGTLKAHAGFEGDMSEAIAINNIGEVIGISNYAFDIGGTKKKASAKSFYWNGEMHEIPCGNDPVAINNKGNVVLNGNNQSLIWNPRSGTVYTIPQDGAVDINDNDMVLFPHSHRSDNVSPFLNEIIFFSDGKYYRDITCSNAGEPLSFIHYIVFNKINNHNVAVGMGTVQSLNERHACVLKPL